VKAKFAVFREVASCNLIDKHQHFRATVYLLFIQSKEINPSTKKPKADGVEDERLIQGKGNGALGVGNKQ
jgi:hypothetical protein